MRLPTYTFSAFSPIAPAILPKVCPAGPANASPPTPASEPSASPTKKIFASSEPAPITTRLPALRFATHTGSAVANPSKAAQRADFSPSGRTTTGGGGNLTAATATTGAELGVTPDAAGRARTASARASGFGCQFANADFASAPPATAIAAPPAPASECEVTAEPAPAAVVLLPACTATKARSPASVSSETATVCSPSALSRCNSSVIACKTARIAQP